MVNGALLFCPKRGAYLRAELIRVDTFMLSTWFDSNLLIVHGKKTQAIILGNPSREPVLHIGDSAIFFKKRNLQYFLQISHDSRHILHKSYALKKKQNSQNRPEERK